MSAIPRLLWCLLCLLPAGTAAGQQPEPHRLAGLVQRLAAMVAVTGYEQAMADTIQRLLPDASRDRAGNVVLTLGRGEPRRLIACPLDEPGYVIGNVREDGYLTLRRVGPARGPLFDQQLEGQRVTINGRRGGVPGVVAVRSVHLTRGRSGGADDPFTVDHAYVDVGASTGEEVRSLGLTILDPVTLAKRPHRYGDGLLAAPAAGRRAACAALLAAASPRPRSRGTIVVAFIVEQNLSRRGLLTVLNTRGPFRERILLDGGAGTLGAYAALEDSLPAGSGETRGMTWTMPVRYVDTAVETVRLEDAAALAHRIGEWMGGGE